ncbi:MAG TPA: YhjD/YihY/BrkB family envelope integrity protein [Verrucomicrobiae bacterium]|nr:YhjD/YihY/BrkB family envelope integrity protein [Verrucomicrobiae bacterium]
MSKKSLSRLIRIAKGALGTGKDDIFSLEASLTRFEKFVHFWVLVGQSFVRNRCPVRASALSYTTMLAMIPMLAVAVSVSSVVLKSQGEAQIERFIQAFVDNMIPAAAAMDISDAPDLPMEPEAGATNTNVVTEATNTNQVVEISNTNAAPAVAIQAVDKAKKKFTRQAAEYIHTFAQKTYSGTLGVTGMFFLILTAILTLTRVEETFNDIWGVTRGRDWWPRIANYFLTIVGGPALILGALSMMSGARFQKTRGIISTVPFLEPLLSVVLPVALICFTFALFYKLVPNTKVYFTAALVGGTLAGVCWHFYNQLGFLLASQAVSANRIYGSLALIPLLMGSLYVVWLTVLFGAQVAYAFQNRASYLQEKLAENVNQRGREFVALRLMTCIGQRFHRGLPPVTIREISAELGIPGKLAQQVLRTLLAARLVIEVSGDEPGYSPARPLESINTHHILVAMRATQGQELVTRDEPVRIEVLGEFARIQEAEKEAASRVTMLTLVNRADARLELAFPGATARVQPEATSKLVTTLTHGGLIEKPPVATEENPEPPPIEVTPKVDFEPQMPTSPLPGEEPKSGPQTGPAPNAPHASTTNENDSFPL